MRASVYMAGLVIAVLVGVGVARLTYGPAPTIVTQPDPRPARAYVELSSAIRDNQHDANSAHARIDALVWQMHVVARSCPGLVRPPNVPWPVLQPLNRSPWQPKPWRLLDGDQ